MTESHVISSFSTSCVKTSSAASCSALESAVPVCFGMEEAALVLEDIVS